MRIAVAFAVGFGTALLVPALLFCVSAGMVPAQGVSTAPPFLIVCALTIICPVILSLLGFLIGLLRNKYSGNRANAFQLGVGFGVAAVTLTVVLFLVNAVLLLPLLYLACGYVAPSFNPRQA